MHPTTVYGNLFIAAAQQGSSTLCQFEEKLPTFMQASWKIRLLLKDREIGGIEPPILEAQLNQALGVLTKEILTLEFAARSALKLIEETLPQLRRSPLTRRAYKSLGDLGYDVARITQAETALRDGVNRLEILEKKIKARFDLLAEAKADLAQALGAAWKWHPSEARKDSSWIALSLKTAEERMRRPLQTVAPDSLGPLEPSLERVARILTEDKPYRSLPTEPQETPRSIFLEQEIPGSELNDTASLPPLSEYEGIELQELTESFVLTPAETALNYEVQPHGIPLTEWSVTWISPLRSLPQNEKQIRTILKSAHQMCEAIPTTQKAFEHKIKEWQTKTDTHRTEAERMALADGYKLELDSFLKSYIKLLSAAYLAQKCETFAESSHREGKTHLIESECAFTLEGLGFPTEPILDLFKRVEKYHLYKKTFEQLRVEMSKRRVQVEKRLDAALFCLRWGSGLEGSKPYLLTIGLPYLREALKPMQTAPTDHSYAPSQTGTR